MNKIKKPYRNFFFGKFNGISIMRQLIGYTHGVRKFSIEIETKTQSLISEDEKWVAPVFSWKIYFGWFMLSGFCLWGKVKERNEI